MSALDRLAERVGIEPFYHDIWGNRRDTSPATMRALIAAMGLAAGDDDEVAASLRRVEERAWRRTLPPVLVVDEGQPVAVPVSAPAGLDDGTLVWTVGEEGGGERHGEIPFGALPVAATATLDGPVGGLAFERRTLTLPDRPAAGYHTVRIALRPHGVGGALEGTTSLIVAPRRGVLPQDVTDGHKLWGIGLQLYALKSGDDWGIGDFDDLGRFAETAGALGADLVGLNPLHALFPADPNHYGPYSPSDRRFLNILYIDVEAVPEFAGCAAARALVAEEGFQRDLAAARAAELVDYPAVARLKLPVLEALHAAFRASPEGDPRRAAFAAFQAEMGPTLRRHALFNALHEHFYRQDAGLWSWRNWPEPFRDPESAEVAAFARDRAERIGFFEFLQFEADRQLAAAAARGCSAGLSVGFYRDLAVAAHPGGATAWADQGCLVQGANVGAPPDQFNMKGQNWGLSPLSPVGLVEAAYAPFIAALRANMRHAGALRIDHVMALKHLFWIPADGSDGAYVEYPFADLLRIVALESRRQNCVVIGEDLGTVPEGFRPVMREAGVLSYRVLYFERAADGGFLAPSAYPEAALVTLTTHDLATFRGFWTGQDLDWRRRLDLYPDAAARDRDAWDRGVDRWRLLQALDREGLRPAGYPTDDGAQPWSWELAEAVHRYLGKTPGSIAMVQIEDALAELEQPNLPGTVDQHPNWRRRLSRTLDAIAADPRVRALAEAMEQARQGR